MNRSARQHNNRNMTPLLICVIPGHEEMALNVLSLRPDADLELGQRVVRPEYECNILHYIAQKDMAQLMNALLFPRQEPPLFDKDKWGHTPMCCAAMGCHFGVVRQSTDNPSPLLQHANFEFEDATLEARLATVKMLVKEFGVDFTAYYPGGSDEGVLPLLTAVFVGEFAMMDLLISGMSSSLLQSSMCLLPFPLIFRHHVLISPAASVVLFAVSAGRIPFSLCSSLHMFSFTVFC